MASVSVGPSSGGGRRELNAEVNLVPFIDLLSVCICFLLMTAVWIQVGALEVKQSHGTEGTAVAKKDYEMDLRFMSPSSVRIDLKRSGRRSKSINVKTASPEELLQQLDSVVGSTVHQLGEKRKAKITAAFVTPKMGVPYGDMVSVLDVLRKHEIVNIGIVPVKGNR